jgi:Tetratricopeptide repeat
MNQVVQQCAKANNGALKLICPLLIVVVFAVFGCATRTTQAIKPNQVLSLGTGRIEVDPTGELPPQFWDSYTLLQEGNTLFDQERYGEAASYFSAVTQRFAGEEVASLALFNLGACYEIMGEYELALRVYKRLDDIAGPKFSGDEVLIRQLSCLEEMGHWPLAIGVADRLLDMPDLPEISRIDVSIRRGIAFYKNRDSKSAKIFLEKALMDFRILSRRKLPLNQYFAAKGYFYLGEIFFDRYETIHLNGAGDELRLQLEAKTDLLFLARTQYLRSMRTYEGRWLAASLHKLGYGYESMFFSMKNAPLPEDLSPSEAAEYRMKLEKRTLNLLNKAVDAYEKNVDLNRRFALESPWAKHSEKCLERLRRYREENL